MAVLGDEVRVTLDVAPADHLHHQVHGELPVEAREERIAGEIDLVLVERCVGGIPLLVRDRGVGALEELGEAGQLRRVEAADRALGSEELECEPHVVALGHRARRHRGDEVTASRSHGEQALGDEPRERVMNGTAGDSQLGRERVEAELVSGGLLPREHSHPQLVVDALVEVRRGERLGHRAGPNMSRVWRQPAATLRAVNVRVRLFAALREQAGSGTLEIELADRATVADVWPRLGLGGEPSGLLYARNRAYVDRAELLSEGDEVAVIPPVSGGDFRLSADPLSVDAAVTEVRDDSAGAIATFIGTTRANSRGRDVVHLEYEAYEGMAEQVMADLASQLTARHELCKVAIHHRVGRVDIGETSVVIAVSAPHRAAALAACKDAIDELKVSVPLWKKETYVGGEEWIGQGS